MLRGVVCVARAGQTNEGGYYVQAMSCGEGEGMKPDQRELMTWHASRLCTVLHGCTNHGCVFKGANESGQFTNGPCLCMVDARQHWKEIVGQFPVTPAMDKGEA